MDRPINSSPRQKWYRSPKSSGINVLLTLLLLICSSPLFAQPEMADGLRAEGKIYVVVGVVLIIFFGLIFYLVSVDRKVSRLEKEISG